MTTRHGLAARQIVLLLILVLVAGGGIYEFAIARPAFMEAWGKISKVDESIESASITADQIEEMIARKPFAVDESIPNIEIRTYRWRSGLPFKNHDIYVVYTKILPKIAEKNPELKETRYYFSASGGTPLTDENLPKERETLVFNRNPPKMAGSFGAAKADNQGDGKKDGDAGDNPEAANDAKHDTANADQDSSADQDSGDPETTKDGDAGEQVESTGNSEEESADDEAGDSDDDGSDDDGSDDDGSDDDGSDDDGSDDDGSDDDGSDDDGSDDDGSDDDGSDDDGSDGTQGDG